MRRREFIAGLGAASLSGVAGAQQTDRVRRIGVLLPGSADNAVFQARIGAFLQELRQLGWTDGRNVQIDTRWAGVNAADIRRHAAELVALAPEVILAHGTVAVAALLRATHTLSIVFPIVTDPVASGIVDTLARPGGNVTGFMGANTAWAGSGSNCSSRSRRA
jgi:putative tryptophan/tyrosine transport system substrate-binding protein